MPEASLDVYAWQAIGLLIMFVAALGILDCLLGWLPRDWNL